MSAGEIRPLDGIGALVTGGAGGIGSTSARFLARDGAVVTLMGRSQDKLDAAPESIRDDCGADVRTASGDAKSPEDVERAVWRPLLQAPARGRRGTSARFARTAAGRKICPPRLSPVTCGMRCR